ncbi:capsule biosynthesis protein [Roseivivax sp. CAU 1753]
MTTARPKPSPPVDRSALFETLRRTDPQSKPPAKPPAKAPSPVQTQVQTQTILPLPRVRPARLRRRHAGIAVSALLCVVLPVMVTAWYLWERAAPRYVSEAGFSVRSEDSNSALELLGGVADLSASSSDDTDILYHFIQSPGLVARLDARLDLRALWSRPGSDWRDPGSDPVFAYDAPGTIEDLTRYWRDRVRIERMAGTGLLALEVEAFTPQEAQTIAAAVVAESAALTNRLSAAAREDAIGYARDELGRAKAQLSEARTALTRFRNLTQIVDPVSALQVQTGVMSSLQEQLAQAIIELDMIRQTAPDARFRIAGAEQRVAVIEARLTSERSRFGPGATGATGGTAGTGNGAAFANLVGEYEALAVDLRFAEENYTIARASLEAALAEANRQSRYLALHLEPTPPEAALRPQRWITLGAVAFFALIGWALTVLSVWAIRDRR